MDKSLKYGLRAGFCFLGIMAAIILLTYGIDIIAGRYDAMRYVSKTYVIFAIAGFAATFSGGYLFPIFLSRSISKSEMEYSGVPRKYIEEVCRGKLLQKYYLNIAWICFVLSFMYDFDIHRLLVNFLTCCSLVSLFRYFKYRKRYKDL